MHLYLHLCGPHFCVLRKKVPTHLPFANAKTYTVLFFSIELNFRGWIVPFVLEVLLSTSSVW